MVSIGNGWLSFAHQACNIGTLHAFYVTDKMVQAIQAISRVSSMPAVDSFDIPIFLLARWSHRLENECNLRSGKPIPPPLGPLQNEIQSAWEKTVNKLALEPCQQLITSFVGSSRSSRACAILQGSALSPAYVSHVPCICRMACCGQTSTSATTECPCSNHTYFRDHHIIENCSVVLLRIF